MYETSCTAPMQDDLLTELLQKNGGKGEYVLPHHGLQDSDVPLTACQCRTTPPTLSERTGVKIIRAPKKKVESAQETNSPYSTAPTPAPAPASTKAPPSQSKQVLISPYAVRSILPSSTESC